MFWQKVFTPKNPPETQILADIVSTINDGIIVYDNNFKILMFNKAAESIFNLRADDAIGKIFSPDQLKDIRFKSFVQVLFPSLAPIMVKHSDSGSYPQAVDLSLDNPKFEFRVSTNRVMGQENQVLGFVKIVRDRTRELELLQAKNEFISVAAHQLRTPLTGLHWAFESLANESPTESQKQIIDSGLEASSYMLKIVNDLLDVSKIEEGQFGYSFEKTDILEFIGKIIFEVKDLAKEAGVKIYFQRPGELLPEVNVDAQKLSMALFNILDNAIKYNVKNGEVVIEAKVLEDKPYIQISVKDTGIGIASEDAKKMFSKFFRADNAVKTSPNGSGLGLFIVKNIIKRHGGDIWIESEINRGSTFYFTLPIDSSLIPQKEITYDA